MFTPDPFQPYVPPAPAPAPFPPPAPAGPLAPYQPQSIPTAPVDPVSAVPPAPATNPRPNSPSRPISGGRVGGGRWPGAKIPPLARPLTRILPAIGAAMLAYDAYQFACSIGLLGGAICPSPGYPSTGTSTIPFDGGQCNTTYRITYAGYTKSGPVVTSFGSSRDFAGPIRYLYQAGRFIPATNTKEGELRVVYGPTSSNSNVHGASSSAPQGSENNFEYVITSVSVARVDGLPDDCGNAAPQPTGNAPTIVVYIPAPPVDPYISPRPNPPKPAPNPTPRPPLQPYSNPQYPGSPYPIVDPAPTPTPTPDDPEPTPIPQPPWDGNPPRPVEPTSPAARGGPIAPIPRPGPTITAPTPTPAPTPAPAPDPEYRPDPIEPPFIPDPAPPECDPCGSSADAQLQEILYLLRLIRAKQLTQNEEINQIIASQAYHERLLRELSQEFDVPIELRDSWVDCDDVTHQIEWSGTGFRGMNNALSTLVELYQPLLDEICNVDAIALQPEWWQARIGANRPQLACGFRSYERRSNYQIVIPHPVVTAPQETIVLPSYMKGTYQGMLICQDNSKFIINCESVAEAERMCAIAYNQISPAFRPTSPLPNITYRKGRPVQVERLYPFKISYFPIGQLNTIPEWSRLVRE